VKLLNSRLIITNYKEEEKEGLLMAHFSEKKLVNLQIYPKQEPGILGNIYVGKVTNIVDNIGAAFIDIGNKTNCYYSLKENIDPYYINEKKNTRMCVGDEVLVQVEREAMKTKAACVSSKLSFTGKYLVLNSNDGGINVSRKIPKEEHEKYKNWLLPMLGDGYGFIVRTNAQYANKEALSREAMSLLQRYQKILQVAKMRTCYSLIEKGLSPTLTFLRDTNDLTYDEIVTDIEEVYEEIKEYFGKIDAKRQELVRFYEDTMVSLQNLYNLKKAVDDALNKKVWLKSGGFLVIEQTEAFVAIDVNTGKYQGGKNRNETLVKMNEEAALEIARQLRIRNLSGIILIDFINTQEKDTTKWISTLKGELKKDPVDTRFIDLTALQIVELTRKKTRKSFVEQYREI